MSQEMTQRLAADVTRCCTSIYSSELATLLLGDTWHPGGLDLTYRLGQLLRLTPASRILDVACGIGTSALALAEQFGCTVIGVDASSRNVTEATARASQSTASSRLRFVTAVAGQLPFPSGTFDVVLCECALCTFADQPGAVGEFARALGPGGRLGLSDVTRTGSLPAELGTVLGRIACVAGARAIDEYEQLLTAGGFVVTAIEPHNAALQGVIAGIRQRIIGAQLLTRVRQLDLPGVDLDQAAAIARLAEAAVRDGRLGYALLVGDASLRAD